MQCYSVDSVAEKKERMGVKKNRTKLYGQKIRNGSLDLLTGVMLRSYKEDNSILRNFV